MRHSEVAHAGMAEVRKCIFWHALRMPALLLSIHRKRNMIANFDMELRCCRPGGIGDPEPRRDEPCVVCARKGWPNTRFPVYLWEKLCM